MNCNGEQQQQQGLETCLVWTLIPRDVKIFQRRGSFHILQFTRCIQSVMKNMLSMNSSSSNPVQPSELNKYLKSAARGG